MKTIELLAVTQSVKESKDGLSPYKMSREHLLPRFEAAAQSAPVAAPETVAPAEPELPIAPAASGVSAAVVEPEKAKRFAGPATTLRQALAKKNPFATSKPERRTPVQTELLLEQVKVVRNDLNDSDLELVAASIARKTEAPVAPVPDRDKTFKGTVWNRLTARLFSIGRSWL